MVSNDVNKIYTIEELISLGKENSLNLQKTNIVAKNESSGIIYPIQNIFRESYRSLIMRYCTKININEVALQRYKYNPKRMSYDLYGGVELWSLLLWLNNMVSVIEFTRTSLIVYDPNRLDVLNTILNFEEENLQNNKENPFITI